jgi:hypothetical protein
LLWEALCGGQREGLIQIFLILSARYANGWGLSGKVGMNKVKSSVFI